MALARVVDTEGSGPRDPGAAMAVNDDGEVAGSSRGGASRVQSSPRRWGCWRARPSRGIVTFGYSDDEAFSVGLTCGGTVHLFLEALDGDR